MTLSQINDICQTGAIGILIVLLGLIKIPQIELNIWALIGRTVGRAINGELMERIDKLGEDFEGHMREEEAERMRFTRQRILRFNDEILIGERHSKEHFDEILADIDIYEEYCNGHPDYKNNKAVLAIKTIKDVYGDCVKDHDFLIYKKMK